MPKPSLKPNWATLNPVDPVSLQPARIQPSAGKRDSGFNRSERPLRQTVNWLAWMQNEWINYFEEITDDHETRITVNEDWIANVDGSQIANFSGIGGANVEEAFDTVNTDLISIGAKADANETALANLGSDDVINDELGLGGTVTDALVTLDGRLDTLEENWKVASITSWVADSGALSPGSIAFYYRIIGDRMEATFLVNLVLTGATNPKYIEFNLKDLVGFGDAQRLVNFKDVAFYQHLGSSSQEVALISEHVPGSFSVLRFQLLNGTDLDQTTGFTFYGSFSGKIA